MSTNALTGEVAKLNFSSCLQLRDLEFSKNGLQGKIPTAFLDNLKKLQNLSLASNRLTGEIPPTFVGNLSSLRKLSLEMNHLEGRIPHEITRCWGLKILSLGGNNFTGTLSPSFFNMTSIQIFSVSQNSLQGTIPSYIGDTMPNLKGFYFGLNQFHGTIPVSFPNASKIQILEVSQNHLVGKVPDNIGRLKDLQVLHLWYNLLGSKDPLNDLAFITSMSNCSNLNIFAIDENRFEGKLPNTIANLSSKLHFLYLGQNMIFGTIPGAIKNLVSLIAFGIGRSLLSGVIPSEIGELHQLQVLSLDGNQLSGKMPLTLFNLTSLAAIVLNNNNFDGNIPSNVENFKNLNELYMNNNKLDGTIPQQVFNLPSLSKYLYLSHNSFTGPLSPAVGKLKTLNALDISGNKLSGEIPDTIGDCLSLEYLDMHGNLFEAIGDSSGKSSTLELKGSIGYIAPEYGMGAYATTCGDVYSYGIFLLEMFTGKRPTYNFSSDDCSSLSEYIETALPDEVMKIVDPVLLACQESSNHGIRGKEQLKNPGKLVEIEESKIEVMKMSHHKTLSLFYNYSSSSALCSLHHHLLFFLICTLTLSFVSSSATLYSNETDRIALLEFKHRISNDPNGVFLNSWNDSVHHCGWKGVSCGHRHPRVVGLELPEMGLVGTISPHIGNLTFLRVVDLYRNMLHGEIPGAIGGLFRLRYLDLSTNALTGEVAKLNLSRCIHLRGLYFAQNGLQGNLPTAFQFLANSKKLQELSLDSNSLTGGIPPSFGNFSSLRMLSLEMNHLEGRIPPEITRCSGLNFLSLGVNNFTGTLSPSFFNITSIQFFAVTDNLLEGTIPSYIGDTMPNLEGFYFGGNKFHGTIPISFPNASKLQIFDVAGNQLIGKVPDNIGRLKDLQILNLGYNLFGSNDPFNDLTFITSLSNCSNLNIFSIEKNRLEGKLPNTIANLSSKLHLLSLEENNIFGTIPGGIKYLVSLTAFEVGVNLLSGIIPSEIGELHKLQVFSLNENQLSGKIPLTLFNLTSLASIFLDNNKFDGNIPSNVENFRTLNEWYMNNNKLDGTIPQQVFNLPSLSKYLDLSHNSFTGPVSPAVGKLKTLNTLDISGNKLSGKIPDTIGDCLSLKYLDMHDNLFEEYGIGAKASTFGDVYSFGILLFEMFTAKRPTDALFMNGGCKSLYEYVEAALISKQVMKIVDPLLLACLESNLGIRQNEELENHGNLVEIEESKEHNFFLSIFKIGLTCASRSPMDRMHMNEVSRELQNIKKAFFA
nr:probable LRR receptor-like serine/threonine-protein kinase At3g47570 [Ipomoea batatas]